MNCNHGNYTLKELKALCVQNKLKSSGTKIELIKKIENIKFEWCAYEKNKKTMKKMHIHTKECNRRFGKSNGILCECQQQK